MGSVLRFLVAGLGSMGKRRIRNLRALGHTEIAGFDLRVDRRQETAAKYGIPVYETFENAVREYQPRAVIVSTPPQHHMRYASGAFSYGLDCFVEASVVDADRILDLAERLRGSNIVVAPSCTMRYFPGPRIVKDLVRAGMIGKPLTLSYQTGQYLPDWHPWESVRDFYVSERATGGCREIVPFELTWLNDVFGDPVPVSCTRGKLTEIDADIDDYYHFVLRYPGNMLACITVEVISRPIATRELRLLGSTGTLVMSADENCVRHARVGAEEWTRIALDRGTSEKGYINPEEPYVAEMADFVSAVSARDRTRFPNALIEDYRVLQTLEQLDAMSQVRT